MSDIGFGGVGGSLGFGLVDCRMNDRIGSCRGGGKKKVGKGDKGRMIWGSQLLGGEVKTRF